MMTIVNTILATVKQKSLNSLEELSCYKSNKFSEFTTWQVHLIRVVCLVYQIMYERPPVSLSKVAA